MDRNESIREAERIWAISATPEEVATSLLAHMQRGGRRARESKKDEEIERLKAQVAWLEEGIAAWRREANQAWWFAIPGWLVVCVGIWWSMIR